MNERERERVSESEREREEERKERINLSHRNLVDFSSSSIQYVSPSEGIPHHWYGTSVYVGDGVAIVGAAGDSDYSKYGNAYVLKNQEGKWVEVAKLTSTSSNLDDGFGSAVSIYLGYALVGAYRFDLFEFS